MELLNMKNASTHSETPPTPSRAVRITAESAITLTFPGWLWCPNDISDGYWFRCANSEQFGRDMRVGTRPTHWHPYQPSPPTERPDEVTAPMSKDDTGPTTEQVAAKRLHLPEEVREGTPRIINVTWRGERGEYGVSVPEWEGGEVVSLADYNALRTLLDQARAEAAEAKSECDVLSVRYPERAAQLKELSSAKANVLRLSNFLQESQNEITHLRAQLTALHSAPTSDAVRKAAEEIAAFFSPTPYCHKLDSKDIAAIITRHCGVGGEDGARISLLEHLGTVAFFPDWDDNGFWHAKIDGQRVTGTTLRQFCDAAIAARQPEGRK